MVLKLVRDTSTKGFTKGKLYVNGVFECYTIEDEDRHLGKDGVKIFGLTAIPKGTYKIIISMSNRFKKFLIEILGVNGFSGVRIHSGNKSTDTEGCIIVGKKDDKHNVDWISDSRTAYEELHRKVKYALSNKEKVTLEIV